MSVWITALGSLLSAAQIGVDTAAVSAAPAASRTGRDAPRFVAREPVHSGHCCNTRVRCRYGRILCVAPIAFNLSHEARAPDRINERDERDRRFR